MRQTGFIVKVGGLFAFLSFYHMPWTYRTIGQWKGASEYLIGKEFYCIITKINDQTKPIQVTVNAKGHFFKDINLTEFQEYEGVVIHRESYGVFVDIGYHYDWKYGSLVGLIHKSTYENHTDLINPKTGDVVRTDFLGIKEKTASKKRGLILDKRDYKKEKLIGTEQIASLIEDKNAKKIFIIDGKYRTTLRINEDIFPDKKNTKRIINNLEPGSSIKCRILRISHSNNFYSELLSIEKDEDVK